MKINKQEFGNHKGQPVHLYTMENDKGTVVKIMNYGATITSIQLSNCDETKTEITCGFDNFQSYFSEAYKANAPYFGCTVGRYSGRIKDGKFSVNGSSYSVTQNNGPNHLHGGIEGFDKKIWEASAVEIEDAVGVTMSLKSTDGEEGYPGNVTATVTFLLNNNNELHIQYEGTTDKATPLSLTNHTYFNLSGFQQNILGHKAIIRSDKYLQPDETNVPDGVAAAVDNSPADLRSATLLQKPIAELGTGFEHYYLFDNPEGELLKVAMFEDEESGRKLTVHTTEPGMLFYTGYYTSDELQRESGDRYGRFRAFCCETHRYPNGPNICHSPKSITTPEEPFVSITVFTFNNNLPSS